MIRLLQHKHATRITAITTLVLFAALLVIDSHIAPITHRGVIFHQLSFTSVRALAILAEWGTAGKDLYLKTVWIDYLLPLSFASFFSAVMLRYLDSNNRGLSTQQAFCLVVPFFAAFFDYVENAYQVVQVLHGDTLPEWVFLGTSIISVIKWALILTSIGIIGFFAYAQHSTKTAATR